MISNLSKFPKQTWKVVKNYVSVREFNEHLENKLGKTIPFFLKYVPKAPVNNASQNDRNFLISRKEGLEKYMKAVLTNKDYYCDVLFEFIKYDAEKEMVIDSRFGTPRNSITADDSSKIPEDDNLNEFYHDFEKNEKTFNSNLDSQPTVRLYDFLDHPCKRK